MTNASRLILCHSPFASGSAAGKKLRGRERVLEHLWPAVGDDGELLARESREWRGGIGRSARKSTRPPKQPPGRSDHLRSVRARRERPRAAAPPRSV